MDAKCLANASAFSLLLVSTLPFTTNEGIWGILDLPSTDLTAFQTFLVVVTPDLIVEFFVATYSWQIVELFFERQISR
jgi:hypothetical protein